MGSGQRAQTVEINNAIQMFWKLQTTVFWRNKHIYIYIYRTIITKDRIWIGMGFHWHKIGSSLGMLWTWPRIFHF